LLKKVWEWIEKGRRRRLLFIAVSVVVFGLLFVIVGGYFKTKRFVERDPGFCALCHKTREAYTLWTRSEHQHVVCQDCHHETQEESLQMLVAHMFQNKSPDGKLGTKSHSPKVEINSCLECHIKHDQDWPAIDASIGHKIHVKKAKVNCLKCHSRSIHRFKDAAESCLDCHKSRKFLRGGMERLHCLSCHNFLNDQQSLLPDRSICLDCHQSQGIMKSPIPNDAPMAKFPCWACHHPHSEEPALVSCTSCHKKMSESGFHRIKAHADCLKCHEPHEWKSRPRDCTSCHKNKISHYAHKACWECHSFKKGKAP